MWVHRYFGMRERIPEIASISLTTKRGVRFMISAAGITKKLAVTP